MEEDSQEGTKIFIEFSPLKFSQKNKCHIKFHT
jgi:hypothetical protein